MNKSKRSKSKQSAVNRRHSSNDAVGLKPTDSAEDLKLAEEIGNSVVISEIAFEEWQKCGSDLDLQIPVWIKSDELLQENLTKTIQFSRTVKSTPDVNSARERDTFTIQIPADVEDGRKFVVKDKGDKKGEFCGDLIIILRVKH